MYVFKSSIFTDDSVRVGKSGQRLMSVPSLCSA